MQLLFSSVLSFLFFFLMLSVLTAKFNLQALSFKGTSDTSYNDFSSYFDNLTDLFQCRPPSAYLLPAWTSAAEFK